MAESGVKPYNYAVSGASCTNEITPIRLEGKLIPTVREYEVPTYISDSKHTDPEGKKALDIPANETVYSIWIGTNELGNQGFLSDAETKGKTIPDYLECVYSAVDQLHANGARYFVLMNVAPLQLSPLCATPENGGVGKTWAWPNKPDNLTRVSYRMRDEADMVNYAYKYKTPYELLVAGRYPGAHFAVMDINGLVSAEPSPFFFFFFWTLLFNYV